MNGNPWNKAPVKLVIIVATIAVSLLVIFSFYNPASGSDKTLPINSGTKLVIGEEKGNGNLNNYYLYFNASANMILVGGWTSNENIAVTVFPSSQLWGNNQLFTFSSNGMFDNPVTPGSYLIEFHGNEGTVITVVNAIELVTG